MKLLECPKCGHVAKWGFEPVTCPGCCGPFPQSDVVRQESFTESVRREDDKRRMKLVTHSTNVSLQDDYPESLPYPTGETTVCVYNPDDDTEGDGM